MGQAKTHILIPYTTQVACGAPGHQRTAAYRHQVTCERCRKSDLFKGLPLHLPSSKASGLRRRKA